MKIRHPVHPGYGQNPDKMVLNEEEPLRTFPEDSEESAGYRQLVALADANEMPEDFLDSHQYSKEEVVEGIRTLGKDFGYFYDEELRL